MGFSIGELFVSLGFDVDDTKLKAFNSEIVSARDGLFKMAAGATAAVVAVGEFISGPIERASVFKQFTDQTGYNAEALQYWARVASTVNNTVSFDKAIAAYQGFTQYVQKIPSGQAGGGLASLLGNFQANQTPEQYLGQLSDAARSGLWAQRFGDNWRSFVIPKLQSMGLGGDFLDALLTTSDQREKMTRGLIQTNGQSKELDDINTKYRELGRQFDAFAQKMTVQYGPAILAALEKIGEEIPVILKEINDVDKELGGWKTTAELVATYFATTWVVGILASIARVSSAMVAFGTASGGIIGGTAAFAGGAGGAVAGAGTLAAGIALPIWLDHVTHWGDKFARGLDSIAGPNNIIDRSIGNIGDLFTGENTSYKSFEPRPAPITSNVTVNIHSNESAEDIAREVGRQIKEQNRKDHVAADDQTNLGSAY